jgi:hypothetical protein
MRFCPSLDLPLVLSQMIEVVMGVLGEISGS